MIALYVIAALCACFVVAVAVGKFIAAGDPTDERGDLRREIATRLITEWQETELTRRMREARRAALAGVLELSRGEAGAYIPIGRDGRRVTVRTFEQGTYYLIEKPGRVAVELFIANDGSRLPVIAGHVVKPYEAPR